MESYKNQSIALVVFKNFLAISAIFLVTVFLHYPLLLNAPLVLQFDEGIQASEIIRLMKGEAFFFYFDYARYHGILHGLFAIPFFWLMGISAMAYKLPPILFYAAYVWTTYLLAKTINKNVAVITLLLLIVPSPALSFLATHNWQNSIIIVLGNMILLLYFKVQSSNKKLPWTFSLFFILGLAIYEYTYAIIYFATIVFMFTLSHPLWSQTRSKISFKKVIQSIKCSDTRFDACLKVLDGIVLLMFTATFFAYVWGGFAIDIFHISIFQIHKFHKAGLQVLVLVAFRLAISRKFLYEYRQWILGLIKKVDGKQWRLMQYGLFGFLSGISPRIFSIFQGNTSKGGKGFDMNIDPISLSKHIWIMMTVRIPEILGIKEPLNQAFAYSSYEGFWSSLNNILSIIILALILFGSYKFLKWKWNSLKKIFLLKEIDPDPALAFILLPLFVVFANALTERGPITLRYAYPLFGIMLIWVAFSIEKIRKKSFFLVLLIIFTWVSFQGFSNYRFYKESGTIDGLTPVKKPFPLESALDFLKSKNTRFVYTDFYTALQAQLVEKNEILVTSNSPKNWGRLSKEKPVSPDNFAVIVNSIGSAADLDFYMADDLYEYSQASKKQEAERIETFKSNRYRIFLDENQIIYKNERIGPHHIFWDIQANKEQFETLKKL
tara:strand:- start:1391 stop:3382 length:1992 start_codon:yes stop_codon:yes gene_type:complete